VLDGVDVDVGQIDFIDDRDDLEVILDGQVEVADGLGFDSLGGVYHQHGPFTGGQAARDLVGEIDVARSIDQIEGIDFAVGAAILHRDRMHLDGDAALPLEVHAVQDLLLHLIAGEGAGGFKQAVGEGRFAVVDMGDDAEISDRIFGHIPAVFRDNAIGHLN